MSSATPDVEEIDLYGRPHRRPRLAAAKLTSPKGLLGVPKTADQDQIKKAYRKVCRSKHPYSSPIPGRIVLLI